MISLSLTADPSQFGQVAPDPDTIAPDAEPGIAGIDFAKVLNAAETLIGDAPAAPVQPPQIQSPLSLQQPLDLPAPPSDPALPSDFVPPPPNDLAGLQDRAITPAQWIAPLPPAPNDAIAVTADITTADTVPLGMEVAAPAAPPTESPIPAVHLPWPGSRAAPAIDIPPDTMLPLPRHTADDPIEGSTVPTELQVDSDPVDQTGPSDESIPTLLAQWSVFMRQTVTDTPTTKLQPAPETVGLSTATDFPPTEPDTPDVAPLASPNRDKQVQTGPLPQRPVDTPQFGSTGQTDDTQPLDAPDLPLNIPGPAQTLPTMTAVAGQTDVATPAQPRQPPAIQADSVTQAAPRVTQQGQTNLPAAPITPIPQNAPQPDLTRMAPMVHAAGAPDRSVHQLQGSPAQQTAWEIRPRAQSPALPVVAIETPAKQTASPTAMPLAGAEGEEGTTLVAPDQPVNKPVPGIPAPRQTVTSPNPTPVAQDTHTVLLQKDTQPVLARASAPQASVRQIKLSDTYQATINVTQNSEHRLPNVAASPQHSLAPSTPAAAIPPVPAPTLRTPTLMESPQMAPIQMAHGQPATPTTLPSVPAPIALIPIRAEPLPEMPVISAEGGATPPLSEPASMIPPKSDAVPASPAAPARFILPAGLTVPSRPMALPQTSTPPESAEATKSSDALETVRPTAVAAQRLAAPPNLAPVEPLADRSVQPARPEPRVQGQPVQPSAATQINTVQISHDQPTPAGMVKVGIEPKTPLPDVDRTTRQSPTANAPAPNVPKANAPTANTPAPNLPAAGLAIKPMQLPVSPAPAIAQTHTTPTSQVSPSKAVLIGDAPVSPTLPGAIPPQQAPALGTAGRSASPQTTKPAPATRTVQTSPKQAISGAFLARDHVTEGQPLPVIARASDRVVVSRSVQPQPLRRFLATGSGPSAAPVPMVKTESDRAGVTLSGPAQVPSALPKAPLTLAASPRLLPEHLAPFAPRPAAPTPTGQPQTFDSDPASQFARTATPLVPAGQTGPAQGETNPEPMGPGLRNPQPLLASTPARTDRSAAARRPTPLTRSDPDRPKTPAPDLSQPGTPVLIDRRSAASAPPPTPEPRPTALPSAAAPAESTMPAESRQPALHSMSKANPVRHGTTENRPRDSGHVARPEPASRPPTQDVPVDSPERPALPRHQDISQPDPAQPVPVNPASAQPQPNPTAQVAVQPTPTPTTTALTPTSRSAHEVRRLPHGLSTSLTRAASRATKDEKVELTLDPIELGKVRFDFTTTNDRMQVNISVERADTLDLLRRHVDELRSEFTHAGFDASTLSFSQWAQRGGQDADPRTLPMDIDGDDILAAPSSPTAPRTNTATGSGLDLRL